MFNDNAKKGDAAFGVVLKNINTRGADKFMVTVGDAIYKKFYSVTQIGDLVSEKIIQTVFTLRAYVPAADAENLIAELAKDSKNTRKSILKEMKRLGSIRQFDPKTFNNAQTDRLRSAWSKLKDHPSEGNKAIKDARLAAVVGICELLNFAKMMHDCHQKHDFKSYALLAASSMTIVSAAIDVASIPAKVLKDLHAVKGGMIPFLGKPSFSYQTLKALGGSLASGATLISAGFDMVNAVDDYKKKNWVMMILYGAKAAAGGVAGIVGFFTSFTYSVQLFARIPIINQFIVIETLERGAIVAGSKLAIKVIGRRILLMAVGGWFSVGVFVIQVIIWYVTPDALEDWIDECAFAAKSGKRYFDADTQEKAFIDAIADVGI